jgi:hypothetical protein
VAHLIGLAVHAGLGEHGAGLLIGDRQQVHSLPVTMGMAGAPDRWFLSSDGTKCEVREAYASSEGLIEHRANIGEALGRLFAEFAEDHFMTVYGEASQELVEMAQAEQKAGRVRIEWFSFLQGLEPPSGGEAG